MDYKDVQYHWINGFDEIATGSRSDGVGTQRTSVGDYELKVQVVQEAEAWRLRRRRFACKDSLSLWERRSTEQGSIVESRTIVVLVSSTL